MWLTATRIYQAQEKPDEALVEQPPLPALLIKQVELKSLFTSLLLHLGQITTFLSLLKTSFSKE